MFARNKNVLFTQKILLLLGYVIFLSFTGCKENVEDSPAFAKAKKAPPTTLSPATSQRILSQEWQDYWYAGKAEITSYKLSQSRYGQLREGTAALIYVTEDFLPNEQVKANRQAASTIPVLKLNTTKKFITGIYPYSVMNSTFYPVKDATHALKISQSIQEWCGHVYMQLNTREDFKIDSHSYFEGEADQNVTLPLAILENELWTQIRLNPAALPTGKLDIIPNFEFIQMRHAELKAYSATATLNEDKYVIEYSKLKRKVTIFFNPLFPHIIEGWEETYQDTRGGSVMTTSAKKITTIKSDYWNKNRTADEYLRENLEL
ncbi:septum formation inhibitor Maf [Dokdonia sp. Hel_I_53]|uniref:septum formation inhibitor Maf n=1 Tax=Dokdonia sp. Hel_I_53 TaxID=1566287 RepID=UPI00119A1ECE|nr:septum formation inhibitor Maf [Dokdonia sp. Hel_I_53]TVZ51541.1 hypothetical protein OD90_0686 [Dokdonia sp. Hel_I_53]